MTQSAAFKAMIQLAMPNIIAPQRATRKFRRFMDDTFKLTDPKHLENLLNGFVLNAEQNTGDTEELVKGFTKFKEHNLNFLKRIEAADWGMIQELKEEEKDIEKSFKKIKNEVKQKDKELMNHKINLKDMDSISDNYYKDLLKLVNEEILRIEKIFFDTLEEIKKRELLVGRDRTQLRGFVFKLDNTIKSELNFNPFKINDEDKLRNKIFSEIENDITHFNKKQKDKLEDDFKKLTQIVTESMNLILQEIIDLVELSVNIRKSLDDVYLNHVEKKLVHEMHLSKKVQEKIDKEFDEIEEHIRLQAEIDFEAIKQIIQKVQGIKNI